MSLVWQDPESRDEKPWKEVPLPLFDQPHATARNTDPDTSHEAAAAFTEERLTEIQLAVLAFFRVKGRATDEDVEDALSGQYPAFSTLRKRRTDLVQRKFLRDSGARKLNRNNRKMIVWEITPEAAHA